MVGRSTAANCISVRCPHRVVHRLPQQQAAITRWGLFMKEIQLTRGMVTIVDDEDYAALAQYKWHTHKHRNTWYAERSTPRVAGKYTTVEMHRQIIGAGPGQQIDHWDGNGLHNWRQNLRYCTTAENQHNHRHKQAGRTSQYLGVSRHKKTGKWQTQIKVHSVDIWLGYYDLESDAAHAYNAAAVKYFGEFAGLNVIEE